MKLGNLTCEQFLNNLLLAKDLVRQKLDFSSKVFILCKDFPAFYIIGMFFFGTVFISAKLHLKWREISSKVTVRFIMATFLQNYIEFSIYYVLYFNLIVKLTRFLFPPLCKYLNNSKVQMMIIQTFGLHCPISQAYFRLKFIKYLC